MPSAGSNAALASAATRPTVQPAAPEEEVAAWTPLMVADWLEATVGLGEYKTQFVAQRIDGAALLEGFDDQELEKNLGLMDTQLFVGVMSRLFGPDVLSRRHR